VLQPYVRPNSRLRAARIAITVAASILAFSVIAVISSRDDSPIVAASETVVAPRGREPAPIPGATSPIPEPAPALPVNPPATEPRVARPAVAAPVTKPTPKKLTIAAHHTDHGPSAPRPSVELRAADSKKPRAHSGEPPRDISPVKATLSEGKCALASFSAVYNAASPTPEVLRDALRRLRACHDAGEIADVEYDQIQSSLVVRL
jgi:hypothetical protein